MADRRTASAAVTFREKEFVLGMLRQSTTRGRENRVRPPPSTTLPRKVGETYQVWMQSDVREWHLTDLRLADGHVRLQAKADSVGD